jgi:hypothetical protein
LFARIYKNNERKIVKYKKVHTGAKSQSGGENGGFVNVLYQNELNIQTL